MLINTATRLETSNDDTQHPSLRNSLARAIIKAPKSTFFILFYFLSRCIFSVLDIIIL